MKSSQFQAWDNQRVMLGLPKRRKKGRDYVAEYKRGELAENISIAMVALALLAFIIGSAFALSGVL